MAESSTGGATMEQDDSNVVKDRSLRIKLKASKNVMTRLKLKQPIEDTPSIAVPTSLNRAGLTAIVNHFLKEFGVLDNVKDDPDILFDFLDLTRDIILRSTLERHLKKYKLTEEDVLELEYSFPTVTLFNEDGPGIPIPDWISSISVIDDVVFAGSFDGSIVVTKNSNDAGKQHLEVACTEESAHLAQITSTCGFTSNAGDYFVATGSKDCSVGIRRFDVKTGQLSSRISTCVNAAKHDMKSFEAICAAKSSDDPKDILLAAGGWSGDIHFFQAPLELQIDEPAAANKTKASAKKKLKAESKGNIVRPSCTLRGHTDNVSSLIWSSPVDPVTLYSGSWDHSLKVWDCVRQVETASLLAQKPFTSLDFLSSRQVLASGHPDHLIRLWDARASGDAVVKLTISGHRGWVSSVAFQGNDSTLLASASYDRTVRVWDIRGGVPLQTIQTDVTGKLFTVAWGKHDKLVLGGSDAVIRTYSAST